MGTGIDTLCRIEGKTGTLTKSILDPFLTLMTTLSLKNVVIKVMKCSTAFLITRDNL